MDTPDRPGTGSAARPGPGRRDLLGELGHDLLAIRRDVCATAGIARESAGLLAEALPRLDDLERDLGALRGVVDALAGPDGDDGPAVDAEDLAARRTLGMAPEPPGPWCWPLMDAETTTAAWTALDRWAGQVLAPWHGLTRRELPDCWPAHRRAVLELTWLRHVHVAAHTAKAPPHLAAEFHARWLPAALAGVAAAIPADRCWPSTHLADPTAQRGSTREREQTLAQPAVAQHWTEHLGTAALG